ncbi:protein FAR1-RELATED SEQUENCE 2-like [Camellia sinensis]|uniref:protein FAR1-RELATED SEQUENCE 2-like n=1 Tax=Camellia sinensis TaxID=4442 RepID=UPI0010364DD5|nr:protein FAR1-RELATED SEQUENCE 2-like [Camellia sinensis]
MEIDSNDVDNPSVNEVEQLEEPKKGMCFSSREEVYTFYVAYAKHVGFSIAHRAQHFGDDGQLKNFAIECSRAGERKKKSEVNPLKPSLSTKIGCKARRILEINDQAGIGVSRNYHSMVVEAGGYESLTFDERDARNYINRARRLRLGEGDVESLQSYFMWMQAHSEKFFYVIDVDEEFRIRNLF